MSKIEQIIDEIEEYVDSCKSQPLSNGTKIIVNKDELTELISELRMCTPDEIKKYQTIIRNKNEILNKAKQDANNMLQQAALHTNELINEHEIMQQAFIKANEIVQEATNQAQEILDAATNDANNIRLSAIQYTDEMLSNMQNIIANMMQESQAKYENFYTSLNNTYQLIQTDRMELMPQEEIEEQSSEDEEDSYQE